MNKIQIVSVVAVIITFTLLGCNITKVLDLKTEDVQLVNRSLETAEDPAIIAMNAQPGDGVAILENVSFEKGKIIADIKGENNPGKSFVGIAFNIQNDSTYEAIYFRPFNFRSPEEIRRSHCIQYIFHPTYSWRKLRTEQPGKNEAEFINPPDPDKWFTARIEVTDKEVMVYHHTSGNLLLKVERLTAQKTDKIGFWTGHNSKGQFRNLRLSR